MFWDEEKNKNEWIKDDNSNDLWTPQSNNPQDSEPSPQNPQRPKPQNAPGCSKIVVTTMVIMILLVVTLAVVIVLLDDESAEPDESDFILHNATEERERHLLEVKRQRALEKELQIRLKELEQEKIREEESRQFNEQQKHLIEQDQQQQIQKLREQQNLLEQEELQDETEPTAPLDPSLPKKPSPSEVYASLVESYETAKTKCHPPKGMLFVTFNLTGFGKPKNIKTSGALKDTPAEACILDVLSQTEFPRFSGPENLPPVKYTYRFDP